MTSEISPLHSGENSKMSSIQVKKKSHVSSAVLKPNSLNPKISNQKIKNSSFLSLIRNIECLLKLPVSESEKKDLVNLLKALESLELRDRKILAQQIKSKILNSGVFLEKRINDLIDKLFAQGVAGSQRSEYFNTNVESILSTDLKALIIRVLKLLKDKKRFQDSAIKKISSDLKKECKELLKFIEKQQNKITGSEQDTKPLVFAIPWQGGNKPLLLKVYLRGRSQQKRKSYKLFEFIVMLNFLGAVKGSLMLLNNGYNLNIFVERDEIKEFVQERIEYLTGSLRDQLGSFNCSVMTESSGMSDFLKNEESVPFMQLVDLRV